MIIASLLAVIISNLIVYCFVFLFSTDSYNRMKLYRLVLVMENLFITRAWGDLQRFMNIKAIFGIILSVIFWLANF